MGVPPPEEEMLMETVWPFSAPVVEPEMVTEESSVALRKPSPPLLMATEMVGATPSITSAASALREPAAPGAARVRMALLPAASAMEPPLSSSAVEES